MIAPTEGALSVLEFSSSSWPGLALLGIVLAVVLAIVFLLWYVLPVILRVVEIQRLKRSCLKNKLIALTWDDGPSDGMTMRLLALLDAYDCPATFLLSGARVLARPDLVGELVSRGHQIGSHGFNHVRNAHVTPWRGMQDVARGNDALRSLGIEPTIFRPPGGSTTLGTLCIALRNKTSLAWWTHDSGDTGAHPGPISAYGSLLKRLNPKKTRLGIQDTDQLNERLSGDARIQFVDELLASGGVVLLHDLAREHQELENHMLALTELIISRAHAAGVSLVRFEQIPLGNR